MNNKRLLALVATVIPFAANAGGFYVGAGVGSAKYESADFVDCIGGCEQFSDNDFAYQLYAGWQLTDAVAVEVSYQDWGSAKDNISDFGEVKVEPSMFTLMAVGSAPIAENFALFGKAGIAFLSIDVSDDFGNSGGPDSEDLALGGGLQWNIGNFGVRGELLWVNAEDTDKAVLYGLSGLWKFGG